MGKCLSKPQYNGKVYESFSKLYSPKRKPKFISRKLFPNIESRSSHGQGDNALNNGNIFSSLSGQDASAKSNFLSSHLTDETTTSCVINEPSTRSNIVEKNSSSGKSSSSRYFPVGKIKLSLDSCKSTSKLPTSLSSSPDSFSSTDATNCEINVPPQTYSGAILESTEQNETDNGFRKMVNAGGDTEVTESKLCTTDESWKLEPDNRRPEVLLSNTLIKSPRVIVEKPPTPPTRGGDLRRSNSLLLRNFRQLQPVSQTTNSASFTPLLSKGTSSPMPVRSTMTPGQSYIPVSRMSPNPSPRMSRTMRTNTPVS
ncbi:unnamed protein product, partial [Protopolystoma xenopodis]